MKNFYDWMESKNINEDFTSSLMNQPMGSAIKRGLGIMDKVTSNMHGVTGTRRIMGSILQQVKQLDSANQKRLARSIMNMSNKNGVENQAINPKARLEDNGGV